MSSDKQTSTAPLRVLRIDASSRYEGSVTRQLTDDFIRELQKHEQELQVISRDLAREPLPYIDEQWIGANFTPAEQRSQLQEAALLQSDRLVQELQEADILVLGVPMYNFNVPAALKAWIDLVARAGLTFRYTENGPQGLLKNKKAYLLLATGGTPIGSAIDFASDYLRHVLGFLGIDDVELISAQRLNGNKPDGKQTVQQQIQQAVKKLQQGVNIAA
ncbi:FMN-dependent NADH-azoreductase [Kaarinaea lacus]